MSKLERKNFDYIKRFVMIGRYGSSPTFYLPLAKWRAYYAIWFVESVKKTQLRLFTGIGKTKKEAVEKTWQSLAKQLKKGRIEVLKDKLGDLDDKENYEEASFISLAPAVQIPKEYKGNLEFYYK